MKKPARFFRTVLACTLALPLTISSAQACTSLLYLDNNGAPYAGRTMELPMELPYQVSYSPVGTAFTSQANTHKALDFTSRRAFVGIGVKDPITSELKITEGVNDQGLSFSLLAFASSKGPADMMEKTRAVLAAIDLGTWALGQFDTVAAVKTALEKQPMLPTALLPLGILKTPFHYTLHDATGASIVIEFSNGKQQIHDNPIGVMTNGPEFQWHQTNLNNYTFLSNKDQSSQTFRGVELAQPDSGIATVALPASNTSVGRFVRAVYYSVFAEKAETPTKAIQTLAHVMNNFDRPRGISIDNRLTDGIANITAPGVTGDIMYSSEYTSWTALSDLQQKQFYVRTYDSINYVHFDLPKLIAQSGNKPLQVSLPQVAAHTQDGTAALLASK